LKTDDIAAISYENWNVLIFNYYFGDSRKGNVVTFSVEIDDLAAMSGLSPFAAEESLRKAILTLISINWNFDYISGKVESWVSKPISDRGIHPAIGILAFTVLAASKMGDERFAHQGFNSANFYVPLRKTLNVEDTAIGAPGNYTKHIERLWQTFEKWLNIELNGSLGRLLMTDPPPERKYVELSMQHAVLRASDRRRLDEFFDDLGLRETNLEIGELKRHLKSWCMRRHQSWSRRILNIIENPKFDAYSDAVLKNEIEQYRDSETVDSGGQVAGKIRLLIDLDESLTPKLNLILASHRRHPEVMVGSDDTRFERGTLIEWFLPFISEKNKVREAFANGYTLRVQSFNFSFDCDESYVFSYDNLVNGWVSQTRAEIGIAHKLMIMESRLDETLLFLHSVCSEEFRDELSLTRFEENEPGFGWVIVNNIRINVKFEQDPPSFLNNTFSFTAGFRLKVLGGLPIGMSPNTYLNNGEPSLSLSDSDTARKIWVSSDQFGVREFDVSGYGKEIDLWKLNLRQEADIQGMDLGLFEISDGLTSVRIEIVDALVQESGPGADSIVADSNAGTVVKGTFSDSRSFRPEPIEISVQYGPALVSYTSGKSEVVSPPTWLTRRSRLGPLSWDRMDFWPMSGETISSIEIVDRQNRKIIKEINEPIEDSVIRHTAGDELLRWVSEVGSGTWEQLRKTSKYLMERHGLNLSASALGSNLSKLGHLEIDWENSRWAVVKPTLNVMPGMGLIAVLTGSRPQIVERRFDEAADENIEVFALPLHEQSIYNPHARFLKCASLEDAKQIAEKLNARFVIDPASRLAASMKSIDQVVQSNAAEPHKSEFDAVKIFDNDAQSWMQISKLRHFDWADGLYEAPGFGRPRYLLKRGTKWSLIEKSYGLFLEYRRVGRKRIFQYQSANQDKPSILYVDRDVILPTIAERSLVMCSGFAPKIINPRNAYVNVPKSLAKYVANKLGQDV
jgi:hypothetical protein